MLRITRNLQLIQQTQVFQRNVSTKIQKKGYIKYFKGNNLWREEQGLPENPNTFGPLTNLPDYTFMDGRPTPMGSNLRQRLEKQKEVAQKIVQYSKELDYAKERYAKLQEAKKLEKENILNSKLKPKGHLLLEKK